MAAALPGVEIVCNQVDDHPCCGDHVDHPCCGDHVDHFGGDHVDDLDYIDEDGDHNFVNDNLEPGAHHQVLGAQLLDCLGLHGQVLEVVEGGDFARGGTSSTFCHR